jgi:uncharacterized protein YjiS (DUF1127 family)
MSIHFGSLPRTFVKHDDVKFFGADTIGTDHSAPKRNKKNPSYPLRDSHIALLAVDALVALHASLQKWRNHRRTLRALAHLDEHQLRDIGLTREEALRGRENYHALAETSEVRRHSP